MAKYSHVRAVAIPRLYGLGNRLVSRRINRSLYSLVGNLLQEQGYGKTNIEVWTEQSITLNDLGVFSLWYDAYAYQTGAAHGLTVRTSASYDLLTGGRYSLASLFKPNSDYIARLSAIIAEQIAARELPLVKEFQQISPNEGFYLTRDALVIYFQTYEYTPYYVGIPEFPIPYTSISDILLPGGPAERFIQPEAQAAAQKQ